MPSAPRRLLLTGTACLLIVGVLVGIYFATHRPTPPVQSHLSPALYSTSTPGMPALSMTIPSRLASPTAIPGTAILTATPIPTVVPTATSMPTVVPTATPIPQTGARDPRLWPFASTSIWNMPLGANARYVAATIGSRGFGTDIDWFVTTQASDPLVPMYMPATWGQGRCAGTTPEQQAQWHPEAAQPIHVPASLIIPDAITSGGIYWTPNSSSAFLAPDGHTLINFNVTARCTAGAPLYGNWFGQSDLYGDGIGGGHGGSGLSSIGGSIRTGELLNDQPIRHALKIDIWGKWMYYDANGKGHRWPAPLADGGAPQQYKGVNPALVMGSLLALPPDVTPESLGITSPAGKKLFQALQNYGTYVVDDSGGDYNALCVEHNADVEFQQATGHTIAQDQGIAADFGRMVAALKVIDNNGPSSIGGGGTPRAPLAPPLS